MRRISLSIATLLLVLAAAARTVAQPQISYIIPDIGAPGMNTYVEIIAPVDATGAQTYGTDNIYLNNPGDPIRVQATGPRAADIVVGPLVVSWSGRLISTQIFVKPNVATGTIPLQVTTGSGSASVDFEIVRPGVINNPGVGSLGSGGALGSRSKRGAMILDSLILSNPGTYGVNTSTDPDPASAGNQGYLPLVLISRGPIRVASGVVIDASANGRDGGPGGGGGGGQVCDKTFLGDGGPGTDGGRGYTGGGAGGKNTGSGSSGEPKAVGGGTGASGNALSGAVAGRGPEPGCQPQGAGGGTGHPFGHGGYGWCSGSPQGEYGGASSGGENSGGGGAGFNADGTNGGGTQTGNNRGREHGNVQLVPLAGGSGGAAANPQVFTGGCGGYGGGGGGAVALFSMDRMTMSGTVVADGASGSSGQSNGGGGSGGGIILGSKLRFSNGGGGHSVIGGSGSNKGGSGSLGRARHDGFISPVSFGTAQPYIGPTSDTLSSVASPVFRLSGTWSGTTSMRVYMRGNNSNWQLLPEPVYSGRNWSLDVTAPGGGLYYFAAFQQVNGSNSNPYTAIPAWVTSQVAANIVDVAAVPRIDTIGTPVTALGNAPPCPDQSAPPQLVMKFKSTGSETLTVRAVISGPPGLTIVQPPGLAGGGTLTYPPDPDSIISVYVVGNPNTPGTTRWDFALVTNDPRPGFDSIPVTLEMNRADAVPALSRDTIDFGDVCVVVGSGIGKDDSTVVRFKGDIDYTITRVLHPNSPFFLRSPLGSVTVSPPSVGEQYKDSISVVVRFIPRTVGTFLDSIIVSDNICGDRTVYLKGNGIEIIPVVDPPLIDFGPVGVGKTKDVTFTIHNTGRSDMTLRSYTFTPPGVRFAIVDPTNLSGVVVPAGDSLEITVRFLPDSVGLFTGRLKIEHEDPCGPIPEIPLRGNGVEVCFQADRGSLTYVADSCSSNPDPLDSIVTLENCGGIDVQIDSVKGVTGKVTFSLPDALPLKSTGNTKTPLTVTWDPIAAGSGIDTVTIYWQDLDDGVVDSIRIPVLMKFDRAVVELQTVEGDTVPSLFDIGGVYQCSPARDTVVLVNAGTVDGEITGMFETGGIFDVDPPLPFNLSVGQQQKVVISIDPANAPNIGTTYTDQLILRNGKCDQEWRIGVVSTRYDLTVDVSGVDFGGTNLGLPRTRSVQIANTTNAPKTERLVIESAYIDPPGASPPFEVVDPSLFPAQVEADSGTFGFDVSFTPDVEQVYNGRLCIHIIEPCDTVICVDLRGEGIKSNIYVPKGNLDFGKVYHCREDTTELTIYSVGPEPLTVDSIRIIGPDNQGFEIVSQSKPLPFDMRIGFPVIQDSIVVRIRFIPGNVPPNGIKNATLEIYSSDSAQGLLEVPLSGERISPTVVGPAVVNFGTVVVNATSIQPITLTNTSADTIVITSPLVGSPFRVVSMSPIVIPPGESVDVDVEFAPKDSKQYDDSLRGRFVLPCDGDVAVALTGEGLRGATVISIPSTVVGEPGEKISIPIVLEEAESIGEVGATTFIARIRFNASMLLPMDIQFDGTGQKRTFSSGSISSTLDGVDRVVELKIVNDPLPAAPDTLGWIDATVLLGNSITTPVSFDTLYWTDGEVATSLTDGEFNLQGYCEVGENRLIRVENAFGIKSVAPNPFDRKADILFETVENGPTTLEIYDSHGAKVAVLLDVKDLPVQAHVATWNSRDVPAGAYYAVLTTPTQRSVRQMILVK